MDVEVFKNKPVMGILRGVELSLIEPLIETAIAGGLETIEITMNTANAPELIRKTLKISGKRLFIGAGTVLDIDSLNSALDAGATFIVTPVVIDAVLELCRKKKIPVFPGALTPREIYSAWNKGATMVKVFPAKMFGPQYFKEIKGPFNDIKLMACGGVTPQNLEAYFQNGADAITFGSGVFKKEWLENKDFESIGEAIKKYLSLLRNVRDHFFLEKNS